MRVIGKGYAFDDVLLVPKYSEVLSRSKIDLSVKLPKGITLRIPIVSSNMKTVTGIVMARKIASLGGMAILHRFDTSDNLINSFTEATRWGSEHFTGVIAASVGIQDDDVSLVASFVAHKCKAICVDVAHGDHIRAISFVKKIRDLHPELLIIAGNVATPEGANRLWKAGADIIKIGIGSGSICTTRIQTGNGYPQLSCLDEISSFIYSCKDDSERPLFIADGGIRYAGDCVKALCFSDLVMLGNVLAGTDESPGDIVFVNGKMYKEHAGSSTYKPTNVEGVVGLVPYKGQVAKVVQSLCEGIQSGCSYQGVDNLVDLKKNPIFIEITSSGIVESFPHDLER